MQEARRWVVGTCRDIGRDDLVECAELGVSELVTNALMHAESPIRVRVRGTREHPRVEVRDASIDVPPLPETTTLQDEADLLLTFGRGLSIVARAADAWGVQREADGKTMWFAPARVFADEGVEGRVTGVVAKRAPEPPIPAKDRVEVELRDVPVAAYVAFTHHYQELRREVGLLALAHQQDYPLAKNLSDLFGSLEQPLRAGLGSERIDAAQAAGEESITLTVTLARAPARGLEQLIELLDLADAFCREERLLSLARTPEQRSFQTWFLSEFVRQSNGHAPAPWRPSRSEVRENSLQ